MMGKMARTFQTEAIILRTYRFGEIHKGVTLLCPSTGLLDAVAFGAYKGSSKLGGSTDPFAYGRFYCYRDPVKDRTKISDADVRDLFEGIRGDLRRYYTACFWAELIIKSYAGGGAGEELYTLMLSAMKALDSNPDLRLPLFNQFAWRFLDILGLRPEPGLCGGCGHAAEAGESVFLDPRQVEFRCGNCRSPGDTEIHPGLRRYLLHTQQRSLEASMRVRLDLSSEQLLYSLFLSMLEEAVDQPLKTVELL